MQNAAANPTQPSTGCMRRVCQPLPLGKGGAKLPSITILYMSFFYLMNLKRYLIEEVGEVETR